MDQLISQVLHDRYHIQSLLGRKPGRRTFMAIDVDDQLPVVIKLMLFSPDFTWDDLKFFEREAATLKSLNHAAIPKYLDFFEVETELGKGFALVQSYIEARSLQEWVQAGCTFSENELKVIAKELLDILAYLHSRQPPVIHRDIKPSNVLLRNRSGNTGQVYLVDFGSVQTIAHGGTVTVVGTYGYMPPEQFGGRSLPASDLYGVGATLIYLATGQHPADLPQKDLYVEFKQLTTLSHSFVDWIEWLTDPSLTRRPASTKDALQSLLKPRQQRKAQLTTQSILLGTRPLYSYISLKATQTTLELKVPSNQIQYFFPGSHTPIFWGCLIPVLIIFLLSAVIQVWVILAVVLYFIGYGIYFSGLSQDTKLGHVFSNAISLNNTTGNRLDCAYVTFHRESGSVISTLSLVQKAQSIVIFRGELKAISAGLETMPQYRLNLGFQDSSDTIVVRGKRQEIQWLCDELSEWTGLQAEHWEQPSA